MLGIKEAALAMYYRAIGKHGYAAEEKTKAIARESIAERESKKAREAMAAFDIDRAAVAAVARRTISLIARANARLS